MKKKKRRHERRLKTKVNSGNFAVSQHWESLAYWGMVGAWVEQGEAGEADDLITRDIFGFFPCGEALVGCLCVAWRIAGL